MGKEVIQNFPYDSEHTRNSSIDYELGQVANVCLSGKDSVEAARHICHTITEGFKHYRISPFEYSNLLSCLARLHPDTFLDIFVGDELEICFPRMRFDDLDREDNPVNQIPENILIDWCEKDPKTRYPRLVQSLQTYQKTKELSWKPIVYSILEKAPNISDVLLGLQGTLHPSSWSGSYADMLEQRLVLFASLYDHPNGMVRDWAEKQYLKLKSTVYEQREHERRSNQDRFERFE